jgi:hypothetical protein
MTLEEYKSLTETDRMRAAASALSAVAATQNAYDMFPEGLSPDANTLANAARATLGEQVTLSVKGALTDDGAISETLKEFEGIVLRLTPSILSQPDLARAIEQALEAQGRKYARKLRSDAEG